MVVDQVDVMGMAGIEAENDTPISSDSHSPKPGQIALERMQPEPRQVHLSDLIGLIETRENALNLVNLIRPELAPIALLVQSPQSTVPEAPDHDSM